MKENVDEVMPGWTQTEELAVGHVRDPGQRMPVVGVTGRFERPNDVRPGQAAFDVRVVQDVIGVVVVQKTVPKDREIDGKSPRGQGKTNNRS